jgi:hypothetical protein
MSLALILAAMLSSAPADGVRSAPPRVDRSLSDSYRLRELEIAVRQARARGEIDRAAATELQLGIARTRRAMVVMGTQVGFRQRVRLRQRIDRLYERLDARRTSGGRRPRS